MASKRARRAKECGRKKVYTTEEKALSSAIYLTHKTGIYYSFYRCRWCSKFHLRASKRDKVKRAVKLAKG